MLNTITILKKTALMPFYSQSFFHSVIKMKKKTLPKVLNDVKGLPLFWEKINKSVMP